MSYGDLPLNIDSLLLSYFKLEHIDSIYIYKYRVCCLTWVHFQAALQKNTGRTILNKGFGPFKNEFSENMFKRTTYYEYKHI